MSSHGIVLTASSAALFDDVPFTEELSPLLEIAAAVVNAGYAGVRVIEFQLINGRYVHILQVQETTPEGEYLAELSALQKRGKPLPTFQKALATLQRRSKC
jgi:hypothetical protein